MAKKRKEKQHELSDTTPSMRSVAGDPQTVAELLRKYGTYNIQPTADADHEFPEIGQQ